MRRLLAGLLAMLRRRSYEQEMDREIAAHLALLADDFERSGKSPEQARHDALRAFGNVSLTRDSIRDARSVAWLDPLAQDIRLALRSLAQSPTFTCGIILTASLAIGANAAIFSLVHAVILNPLPYPESDRLVTLAAGPTADFRYAAWRSQSQIFHQLAAFRGQRLTLSAPTGSEQVLVQLVTPQMLSVLRVSPEVGRDFNTADAQPRGGDRAIISHLTWVKHFNRDPAILSRTLLLNGNPHHIIGVLPAHFEFPDTTQPAVLVPLSEPVMSGTRVVWFVNIIARLQPGVTLPAAHSSLLAVDSSIRQIIAARSLRGPDAATPQLQFLQTQLAGNARPALLLLWTAVALVLLIGCANILNLLFARSLARRRELAIRMALGAGRLRIAAQLLTEGMLLALLSGATGLAIAALGIRALIAIAPREVPHLQAASLNPSVLLYTTVLTMLIGIAFGLWPLRSLSRAPVHFSLKQSSRSATGSRGQRRAEGLLVVAEAAFAVVLLLGAGLMIQTVAALTAVPRGFDSDHLLTGQLSLPFWKYESSAGAVARISALLESLRNLPGVESASAVCALPYSGFALAGRMEIAGQATPGDSDSIPLNIATGPYFAAMRIPLLAGRVWDHHDSAARPPVAVISQELVRRYFPQSPHSAIGQKIRISGITPWMEVIGVVGDVRQTGVAAPIQPMIYQPATQSESGSSATMLVLRTQVDPELLMPALRASIRAFDDDLPPPDLATMNSRIAALIASRVFLMRLLTVFAAVAILLSAAGIYCVLSCAVQRRWPEIGIRLAFGARHRHISGMVLRQGLLLTSGGVLVGLLAGQAFTQYLEDMLYGIRPHDPLTLGLTVALMIGIGLLAASVPALRAMRQSPLSILRLD